MSDEAIKLYGTPEEQLNTINEAIYTILKGGQSYKIGTRELVRANLNQLLKMQKLLQAAVQGGEPSNLLADTFVAVFQGR